jgi:predicted DNA-binding transcriptional regulator AlpA
MEEYLTINELSARIKFSKQSLYNLIHRGTLVLGKHYLKTTPKKVLFKWSEILAWMGDLSSSTDKITPKPVDQREDNMSCPYGSKAAPRNLINI